MATNLALDDKLIEEARRLGGHKTKKDAVTAALQQYVQDKGQLKILELFGTVDFNPAYDYKKARYRSKNGAGGHADMVVGAAKKPSAASSKRAGTRNRVRRTGC